jgi:hypothetical protein
MTRPTRLAGALVASGALLAACLGASPAAPPLAPPAPAGFTAGLVDEAQEIFPDPTPGTTARRFTVHAARNTLAGVSVLVHGLTPGRPVRLAAARDDGPVPDGRWYRFIDVPVAENTGLDRNTEKYSAALNPHVIRRAPFRVYDPLEPVASPVETPVGVLALRFEVPVAADAAPGPRHYRLTLASGEDTVTLEFTVMVHRATVPPLTKPGLAYINWHSLDNLCSAHRVEKWSEPFWAMLARYAQLMARGRQNAFWFNWPDFFAFDAKGDVVAFHRERLERYIRTFLDAGLTTIHGAPMCGRRTWGEEAMLLYVPVPGTKEIDAVSDLSKHMLRQMSRALVAVMRANGWERAWVQGVFDEPEDPFVARYRELIAVLREAKPDLRVLEATMTTNVTGLVDIWCPQVHEYQKHREFFDARRAAGDRVWVYTCLAPGGPWLNRLLDQERLRQVYLAWACAKFDLQGFLHWGGNFHTERPFEELVRYHMPGQYLPAGDSHVFYPGKDGPLSSHRFEAHRIGFEDYELLAQLKARDPARAAALIDEVVQGFDRYRTDVVAYRTTKLRLLEAVDALAR